MARRVNSAIGINLSAGSSSTVPEFTPGETVRADSGIYMYGQANGAVTEGYICKYVEGTYDFDTVTHTEGDSVNYSLGVNVTAGGLADNYWGWFWRGQGSEYVYVKDSASADVNMLLTTTAGMVGDNTDGTDVIHDLFTNATVSAAGLALCRSTVLLSVNASITN